MKFIDEDFLNNTDVVNKLVKDLSIGKIQSLDQDPNPEYQEKCLIRFKNRRKEWMVQNALKPFCSEVFMDFRDYTKGALVVHYKNAMNNKSTEHSEEGLDDVNAEID